MIFSTKPGANCAGTKRMSTLASQASGMMFVFEPPRIVPMLIVGEPSTGS